MGTDMHLAEKKTAAVEEALRDRSLTSTEKLVLIAIIHNANIPMVDHLGLMNHGKANGERLDQAIARTTGGLKELAGELDCAVVALAQLNRSARSVEGNKGKGRTSDGDWWDAVALPTMSDLREAGAIEQDADVILSDVDSPLRATVTIGWLAQRTGFAVRTVQRSVGLLETRRFLRIQRSIGGGNHYTILQVKE